MRFPSPVYLLRDREENCDVVTLQLTNSKE